MRTRAGDWATVPAAALAAAAALVLLTALIAEIAAAPTAAAGVSSSTWTPCTAIAAAVLGGGAFHGGLAPGPILFGWLLIALGSLLLGAVAAALIAYALGWRPHPVAAAALGAALGLAAEIAVFNVFLNWLQADNAVYRALPSWGWWVGMAAWGATLGLAMAARRGPATSRPAGERAAPVGDGIAA